MSYTAVSQASLKPRIRATKKFACRVEEKPPMKIAMGHRHKDTTPNTRNQIRQLETEPAAMDFMLYLHAG